MDPSILRRTALNVGIATIAAALVAAGCGSSSQQTGAIGAGLTGPTDLRATTYATGLKRVAAFAIDPSGRLWVATADYTDTGHDGLYVVNKKGARPVEVVPALHTPLGLLWYHDALYVASTGRVDAFGGFDGTKFATRRTILKLPAKVGESNNIVLSSDGRMLMGISSPCDHCTPKSKLSAAIISFRPDGSDLRVFAGGIHAPVGLAYYPGTNNLLVTMNQRDDLGSRTPGDWLALVRDGQNWKFPECYGQTGTACTGVPQPVAVLDKHAAAAGIVIATGQLGSTVGTAALVAQWAKGTVLKVPLDNNGTTARGKATVLFTGVTNPVALTLTSGGSLFVGDWASGRIYEITRRTSNP